MKVDMRVTHYFKYFRHTWSRSSNMIINLKKTLMFICTIKIQLHPSLLSWDIARISWTCYFGYFGHDWQNCRKVWCLSTCKKSTSFFPWDTAKILQNFNFGYFGHTWLWASKTISACVENFDVYLHAKNQTFPSPFSWDNAKNGRHTWYFG